MSEDFLTRHRRLMCTVFAVSALAWAVARFGYGYIHGDEGVALNGAWRITLGERPHADFFEIIPPGSFLPTALAFELFGVGFFAARAVVLLCAIGLVVACDRLLAAYTGDALARLALALLLVPLGVFAWPLPSHHWWVDLGQLAALLCLLRGLAGEHPERWGAAAGAASSFACFCLQDQGGLFLLALIALVFPWVEGRERRKRLVTGWVAGGLAVAGLFALYLLPRVSIGELLRQWIVHPATRYHHLPQNAGWTFAALGWSWIGSELWVAELRFAPLLTLGRTASRLLGPALLPAAPALLVVAWRRGWTDRSRVGLLAAGAVAFIGAAARRLTEVNLLFALPLLFLILAWGIARARADEDQRLRQAGTVAGWMLVALGLALAVGTLRAASETPTVVVRGRGGTLRVPARTPAAGIRPILAAVERHVPPDAPLFVTGYHPLINFFTQRRNPTRYQFFLHPGYHTDAQRDEAIASLRAAPRAAVMQAAPYGAPDAPLNAFLTAERRVVWTSNWGRLWVPR